MEVLPSVNYTACATLKVGTLSPQVVGTLVIPPSLEDFMTSLCLPLPARAQTLTMAPKAYAR